MDEGFVDFAVGFSDDNIRAADDGFTGLEAFVDVVRVVIVVVVGVGVVVGGAVVVTVGVVVVVGLAVVVVDSDDRRSANFLGLGVGAFVVVVVDFNDEDGAFS